MGLVSEQNFSWRGCSCSQCTIRLPLCLWTLFEASFGFGWQFCVFRVIPSTKASPVNNKSKHSGRSQDPEQQENKSAGDQKDGDRMMLRVLIPL